MRERLRAAHQRSRFAHGHRPDADILLQIILALRLTMGDKDVQGRSIKLSARPFDARVLPTMSGLALGSGVPVFALDRVFVPFLLSCIQA